MVLLENLLLALQSLRANPLRSVLTLIGMAVGIAAVLYVVTLGEITKQRINEQLESLGSNVLTISPGFSRMGGVRTGANVVNLSAEDALEISRASHVIVSVAPSYSSQGTAEYLDKNYSTRISGTVPNFSILNNDLPIQGRYFTQDELDRRERVCVLGATVNEELFGNQSPIGESIVINARRFTVIGLLGSKGEGWGNPDDQIFIPLTTAQERLFGVTHLSNILAQISDPAKYDEALFDIETILRRNHRLAPDAPNDFRVRRQDFFLSTIQQTNEEIANFIVIIAFVSLIVGGIGIANVMLVSVTERTREIGIRRAIGAKRRHILTQFMTESVILGIFGGFLGLTLGTAFNQYNIGGDLILPWVWIGYSFLICAGIGGVAGIYPAVRAANANVIDSIRYE